MSDLLAVDDVLARTLAPVVLLPAETIALADALNRVLATDITSPVSIPPFANSSMDGFALRAADVQAAHADNPVTLRVVADIPAGQVSAQTLAAGEAARIMTGAPIPDGADAVIPVEDTDAEWASDGGTPPPLLVTVRRAVRARDYVRPVGEDIAAGQIILTAGSVLRPQDIGVLAAIGQAVISVRRQPRVAIIATGDELVEVDQPLAPGQIRNSNSYVLEGLVHQQGGVPLRLPVARDTLDDVRRCFREALDAQPDLIVSTAGVSVGAHDVVRTVIDELGEVALWRVNVRPGKPLAYGQVNGVPFFGLPGNPVSAMVTFDIFVRPVLRKMLGLPSQAPTARARVGEPMRSDGRRTYARVTLRQQAGELVAYSTGTQSSGALSSMVKADGLLIIPEGVREVAVGTRLPVRLLRPREVLGFSDNEV